MGFFFAFMVANNRRINQLLTHLGKRAFAKRPRFNWLVRRREDFACNCETLRVDLTFVRARFAKKHQSPAGPNLAKMHLVSVVACCCALAASALAVMLPDYIRPCPRSSGNFKECALKSGKDALPHVIRGDKKYKIPPMDPLHLPEISLNPSSNFRLKLKDLTIRGLETADLKDVDLDSTNKKMKVTLSLDHLVITGQYDMDGRLIIPLSGTGPTNITVNGVNAVYVLDYDTTVKGGEEYLVDKGDKVTYTRERVHYQFDNLLGNKEISDRANNIINENAEEVGGELREVIAKTIAAIINNIIKNILTIVPIKDIFP